MEQIVELLDKYAVEDFDNLLIQIVMTFAEQRKIRMEEEND
jgi:hypothetical protein|tara:strand:+ start:489 stop:611 length:123 start_codon:yes stop_codon:yes gene_type:complete